MLRPLAPNEGDQQNGASKKGYRAECLLRCSSGIEWGRRGLDLAVLPEQGPILHPAFPLRQL